MKKLLLFSVLLSFIFNSGCTRVSPGYEGFKYSYAGDSKGKPEVQEAIGWTFFTPGFSTVVAYPMFVQHWEGRVTVFCKGGASLECPVGYNYQVIAGNSGNVFFKFKTSNLPDIADGFLFNTLRNTLNEFAGTITLDSLISNTPAFRARVAVALTDSFFHQHFKVDQFGFTAAPHILDDNIRAAVNRKIQAKQDAETAVAQLQTSIAEANKKKATARGDSAALVINAMSEANAIDAKRQQITPEYVEYIKWSNWNGVLPQTVLGSNTGILLNK